MKRHEVCRKFCNLAKFGQKTLVYYITAITLEDDETGGTFESFGVAVKISETGEEAIVNDITTVNEKIHDLINHISSNFVTPVSLFDVVYDWMD